MSLRNISSLLLLVRSMLLNSLNFRLLCSSFKDGYEIQPGCFVGFSKQNLRYCDRLSERNFVGLGGNFGKSFGIL